MMSQQGAGDPTFRLGRGTGTEYANIAPSGASDATPSFLVVGPPRTGTTWVHKVLNPHANLPSPTKETRFFDLHYQKGWRWYRSHFPSIHPDRPTGEVAPTYFASAEARERIAESIPRAKLIFIFRNPVQRVVSLYRLKRAYGMIPWSLDEALERDPELLASSRYATHLREWQRLFPPEQLQINIYDDLRRSPQMFMDRLTDFIEAPRIRLSSKDLDRAHTTDRMTEPRSYLLTRTATAAADWCKAWKLDNIVSAVRESRLMKLILGGGTPFPSISGETVERIGNILQPEVESLEVILGRDLSAWKRDSSMWRNACPNTT
jgi:hypothetical protein